MSHQSPNLGTRMLRSLRSQGIYHGNLTAVVLVFSLVALKGAHISRLQQEMIYGGVASSRI